MKLIQKVKCFIVGHRWSSDEETVTTWKCLCGDIKTTSELHNQ